MAKRPPQNYQPGELQQLRSKLGPITREEATRMVRVLGGEVGVERTDDAIDEKYSDLKYLKTGHLAGRHRRDRAPKVRRAPAPHATPRRAQRSETPRPTAGTALPRASYLDRLKTDFLAASPEYGLKSTWQALVSVLSILTTIPDRVRAAFWEDIGDNLLKTLEGLVLFVRDLCSEKRPAVHDEIARKHFYFKILVVIAKWDVEKIRAELKRVRQLGRKAEIAQLARLCAEVYRPLFMLGEVEIDLHIGRALRRAFDVNMAFKPKHALSRLRLQDSYSIARTMLPKIFHTLKKRLYPLLMKLVSGRYYDYETFMRIEREGILRFLNLNETDILAPQEEQKTETPQVAASVPTEAVKQGRMIELVPAAARRGIEFLELLFPRIAWRELDAWPDLFPYFQPIFQFPAGFELVSRKDPVHQVVVLLSILREMLHGFRNVEWGQVRGSDGDLTELGLHFEEIIDKWPLFLHEVLTDLYIPKLSDFCRQIERSTGFMDSDLALKMQDEMNWVKRTFFLPYFTFKMHFPGTGVLNKSLPTLFETVASVKQTLTAVNLELERLNGTQSECDSVRNARANYHFEVDNSVSKRLDLILRQKWRSDATGKLKVVDKRTNSNLIRYTHSVVELLHFLLNTEDSFYYPCSEGPLFRSVNEEQELPEYSVTLLDTTQLLDTPPDSQKRLRQELERLLTEAPTDPLTGFYTGEWLRQRLEAEIHNYHSEKRNLSLLHISLLGFRELNDVAGPEAGDQALKDVGTVIRGIVQDTCLHTCALPFRSTGDGFVVVLPNTELADALAVAGLIRDGLKRGTGTRKGFASTIGVAQCRNLWTVDSYLVTAERVMGEARNKHKSAIAYLSRDSESIEFV